MGLQQTVLILGLAALLTGLLIAKAYFAHQTKQRQVEADVKIERQQTQRLELYLEALNLKGDG